MSVEIPFIDPWWDLYLPACFGEVASVLDALEAAELVAPPHERGDLYAVAARAFLVLGRFVEAERLAEQAFAAGGTEADALATFLRGDGERRANARIDAAERPGLVADAACDLAAVRLSGGDADGARAAIARALDACPNHREARRWSRLLEADDIREIVREARDPRRARRAHTGPVRDAVELIPTRRTGWLSNERYVRRLLGVAPARTWAPSGTALGALQDAGIGTFYFALDAEYGRIPSCHPLVPIELAADEVRSLVEEGRDARVPCALLWRDAAAIDVHAAEDAAQLLVGLATHDPRLATQGMRMATWLAEHRPDRVALWDGYRAWLSVAAGSPDLTRARSLAALRPTEPLAWRLGIEVIRAAGEPGEADALIRAARQEPALCPMAIELLEREVDAPFRMIVSGRLVPRWPDGRIPKDAVMSVAN